MRKRRRAGLALTFALAIVTALTIGGTSVAVAGTNAQVCGGTHLSPEDQTSQGIQIDVSADEKSVTFTVPEGLTLVSVCLKAGSVNQGCGPENTSVNVVGPGSITVATTCDKELSHLSITVSGTTTGGTTTGGTTTGGTTTGGTTTGGTTTGGTTTGGTTTGGTTTGGGDTTGGGGGGGGGAGGGGGGSVATPTSAPAPTGQLPFTGFPALIALLAGSALLAGGIAVYRRARHDS